MYDKTSAMTGIEVQNDFQGISDMVGRLKETTLVPVESDEVFEPLNSLNNIKPRFRL